MNRRRLSFLLAFLLLLCSIVFRKLPVSAVTHESAGNQTRAAITHNLFYSDYSSADYYVNTEDPDTIIPEYPIYYDDGLQLRANCYGYAFRFFYQPEDINPNVLCYAQMPGDFANKTNGVDIYDPNEDTVICCIFNNEELEQLYEDTLYSDAWTDDEKMDILVQLMQADARTLNYSITNCPASSVPASQAYTTKRLIAVVVGGDDFHFYMQHSDGSWSHKLGPLTPDNDSISGHNLTNSNISTYALEDQYANGVVRFYYITKNSVIDYGHANGHYNNCIKTYIYSTDGAGNDFETSKNLGSVSSISKYGLIDFCGDVDYYYFTPTTTKTYTFTSTTSSSLPLTITLYNASGTLLTSGSANSGAVNFTYQLQSGTKYFIKVNTSNQTEHEYLREYNFYVS